MISDLLFQQETETALIAKGVFDTVNFTPQGPAGIFALYVIPGSKLGQVFLNEFVCVPNLVPLIWALRAVDNILECIRISLLVSLSGLVLILPISWPLLWQHLGSLPLPSKLHIRCSPSASDFDTFSLFLFSGIVVWGYSPVGGVFSSSL